MGDDAALNTWRNENICVAITEVVVGLIVASMSSLCATYPAAWRPLVALLAAAAPPFLLLAAARFLAQARGAPLLLKAVMIASAPVHLWAAAALAYCAVISLRHDHIYHRLVGVVSLLLCGALCYTAYRGTVVARRLLQQLSPPPPPQSQPES